MRLLKLLLVLLASAAGPAVAGPFEDGFAAYKAGDYVTTLRLLRPLADQGNAQAQNVIGFMHELGRGVAQNYVLAMAWYRKAADQTLPAAQNNLGNMYRRGVGVAVDYAVAMAWYRRAADQGLADAQNNIGFMYQHGQGVPQDYAVAMAWFRKAADQGLAAAQNNIGFVYKQGQGVPQDYAVAMAWYRKAVDQGLAHAQNNIGFMYENGSGVPMDYALAMAWYRKAANQGLAEAQNNLRALLAKVPNSASSPTPSPLPLPSPPDPLVVSVQTLLSALGYDPGPPDGFTGPKTSAAITAFQQKAGEKVDGRPSDALRARLQSALAERGPGASQPKEIEKPPVNAKKDTEPSRTGTGFFVSGDILVTNHHVVDACAEVRIRKHDAEVGGARVIAVNRGDDLAALRAEKPSDNYLKLRIGVPVKPAEFVLVFGYPLSGALSSSGNTTLGNVTALTGLRDDSRYIQVSASVQPGNSGGPVLDEAGRLVGVIEGKLDALKIARATGDIPQNVNFAIRATTLANFLEANRVSYEVATSSTPIPNTQLAEQAEAASVQLECRK